MTRKLSRLTAIVLFLFAGAGLLSGCILVAEPSPLPTDTDVIALPTAGIPVTETTVADTTTPEDTPTSEADTPMPEETETPLPTETPTQTPSPTPLPLALQPGTPAYIANFAYPGAGCNWSGVAGQVFNAEGDPVTNLVVMVSGLYGGKAIEMIGVTGTVAGDIYGPGGYEIVLGNSTLASAGTLAIQVFDLDANPLSAPIPFDTFKTCIKNLAIINFSE